MDVIPVYLIHFREPRWCSDSVAALSKSREVDAVIRIVDNSNDLRIDASCATVLPSPNNVGFAGGANIALRAELDAGSEFVLIGSHDLLVEPTTVEELVDSARRCPRAGLIAPRYDEPKHQRCSVELPPGDVSVDAWVGACMLIRLDAVRSVGMFDESFSSYLEDIDYCDRLRRNGWDVIVSPARAATRGTSSDRAQAMTTVNWVLFDWKRTSGVLQRLRLLAGVARGLLRSAVGSANPFSTHDRRSASRRYRDEWLRVLRTLRAVPELSEAELNVRLASPRLPDHAFSSEQTRG